MSTTLKNAINKLNHELINNLQIYEPDLLEKMLLETLNKLEGCKKVDKGILNFLQNKSNFKTTTLLNEFIKSLVGTSSKKKKRLDAEIENSKILSNKGITLVALSEEFTKVKKKEEELTDMSRLWLNMDQDSLFKEFKKYESVTSLKKAAGKLLKTNEKKLKSKAKIETAIINRINEIKATVNIGK